MEDKSNHSYRDTGDRHKTQTSSSKWGYGQSFLRLFCCWRTSDKSTHIEQEPSQTSLSTDNTQNLQIVNETILNNKGVIKDKAQREEKYIINDSVSKSKSFEEFHKLLKEVENLPSYDYEAAAKNFETRYRCQVITRDDTNWVRVIVKIKGEENFCYMNDLNFKEAMINFSSNFRKERDIPINIEGTYTMHLSDIIHQMPRKVADKLRKEGKSNIPENILKFYEIFHESNLINADIVNRVRPYFKKNDKHEFPKGSQGYYDILTSETGKGKVFYLGQHYKDFEFTNIIVKWGTNENAIMSIIYIIEKKSGSLSFGVKPEEIPESSSSRTRSDTVTLKSDSPGRILLAKSEAHPFKPLFW